MWRKLRTLSLRENGQALPLFAAGLVAFLVCVGLSVDVGRAVWARTQMQAAVDAAALAAAQSMPDTAAATSTANVYWNANNGKIASNAHNLQFSVSFPTSGNRRLALQASADVDTWFTRFIGFNSWHVTASGEAESQVLDIVLVLDTSQSECWDLYKPIDKTSPYNFPAGLMGPGKTADRITLVQPISASSTGTFSIYVNSTSIFRSTNASTNEARFGFNMNSTPYWQYTPSGGRRGMLQIDNELFLMENATPSTSATGSHSPAWWEIRVTRAKVDNWDGVSTTAAAHPIGSVVKSQHSNCLLSAPSATAGPFGSYDQIVADAQHFVTLFNDDYDKIGLASFDTTATKRDELSTNFATITSHIGSMGGPDGGTNSAHGIAVGRQILDGAAGRTNSNRVLVFLTDGRANSYCGSTSYDASKYNGTSCSSGIGIDGNNPAVSAAYAEATRLANDKNTRIYTIGVGDEVDDAFLTSIANIGGGKYYKAPTTASLSAAFTSIAAQTHISLVK